MAAAYAAVVSVMHLMKQIQAYHVQYPIFVDTQQTQLESLSLKVSFLLDFLETHSDGHARNDTLVETFACRIVDACYAVQDVIELYIVQHIHGRLCAVLSETMEKQVSTNKQIVLGGSIIHLENSPTCFSLNVRKITEYIDSIEREILYQSGVVKEPQLKEIDQANSLGLLTTGMDTLVGLDDISNQIMDKVTAPQRDLQFIPITGMGGSGKSTLAKKVYDHKGIQQHFDICRWVTVSQEFNVKSMLLMLLGETESLSDNHELGGRLHKMLFGRRYLIVIDDIWSCEAWDGIRLFLPDNAVGSRIIITTRLWDLASDIGSSNPFMMNLLNENESWSLLQKKAFLDKSCPSDLVEIGTKIARDCKGLPLSIVVIGGLLAKSVNVEYWKSVASDVSNIVNSEEDERCLKLLDLSYRHLPIHLKPCFLYFGMLKEDEDIRISMVARLWVAEGFVKPKEGKTLEEVATVYCKNLMDRNLIFATRIGCTGNVKRCKIHDLLRDLCLREAEKQRFFYASKVQNLHDISQGFSDRRRIALLAHTEFSSSEVEVKSHLESSPFLRSFMYNLTCNLDSLMSLDVKLLGVLVLSWVESKGDWRGLLNSRYLEFGFVDNFSFPRSTFHLLWNLQTIRVGVRSTLVLSSKIWEMPQLRHVCIDQFGFEVEDSCDRESDSQDNMVSGNLQSLSWVVNFRCSEEVLMKIPNVKKLKVEYTWEEVVPEYIKNIGRMSKLESLSCCFPEIVPLWNISEMDFSHSLKKLFLCWCEISWEDIGEKIGVLPHLEKLDLTGVTSGGEWNPVEGQFCYLKHLELEGSDLVVWTTESSNIFPCLEKLVLYYLYELEEIPCEIGEIPTLRSIEVYYCSDSASDSAEQISEELGSFGNEDILIEITKRDGTRLGSIG